MCCNLVLLVEFSTLGFDQAPFSPKQIGQSLDEQTLTLPFGVQLVP